MVFVFSAGADSPQLRPADALAPQGSLAGGAAFGGGCDRLYIAKIYVNAKLFPVCEEFVTIP